jgi:NAD(P)-dependent dehydrogenase (short-subunit alcohol dehydrogenase family)
MLKQGWGRVINVSMNYETMKRKGFSPYGPSKAALESMSIIWAQDIEDTGITVNQILPGGATEIVSPFRTLTKASQAAYLSFAKWPKSLSV